MNKLTMLANLAAQYLFHKNAFEAAVSPAIAEFHALEASSISALHGLVSMLPDSATFLPGLAQPGLSDPNNPLSGLTAFSHPDLPADPMPAVPGVLAIAGDADEARDAVSAVQARIGNGIASLGTRVTELENTVASHASILAPGAKSDAPDAGHENNTEGL